MTDHAQRVIGALNAKTVTGKPNQFLARCPAHDDKHPSLAVTVQTDGKILLCCRSQHCTSENIVAAVGLTMADLFPPKPKESGSSPRIVATYDYTDENGKRVFQVVRSEPKTFRVRHQVGGGWIWNLEGVQRVLYRLQDVTAALQHGETIFITEGEKDADNLRKLGIVATCNPGGAGKWRTEYTGSLKGANIVIVPDNDDPGRTHADRVGRLLQGVAASVRVLGLPNLPPKGDVSDWIDAGGTKEEFRRMTQAAPLFEPAQPDVKNVENGIFPARPEVITSNTSLTSSVQNCKPSAPSLGMAARLGLAGEFLRLVEPETEADPAALLLQFLAMFGTLVGRKAWIPADGTTHYPNLFTVIVGESAKARKGTSWNHVRRMFGYADSNFVSKRTPSGLSSGEGLIHAVRDPIEVEEPVRQKNGEITRYQTIVKDRGEDDKRLFVHEGEFGRTLKAMQRDGNILSAVIRQAWDGTNLQVLTKSPAMATAPHISIAAHITREELQRLLTECDSMNGFANRFLWTFARRSKMLPDGGQVDMDALTLHAQKVRQAFEVSKDIGEMSRDNDARELWGQEYERLTEAGTGLLGALTNRGDAQTLRLSMIYALLDGSKEIRREHLEAALAVWQYCENSARYLFGSNTGDALADKIHSKLVAAAEKGMTRTEINRLFGSNIPSERLTLALETLRNSGRAVSEMQTAENGGRPSERWFATSDVIHGKNVRTSKFLLRVPKVLEAEAHEITKKREATHSHAPKPESNGSAEKDYAVSFYGTLWELAAIRILEANGQHPEYTLVSDHGVCKPDLELDGRRIELKAAPTGSDSVKISIPQHENPKRRADYIWPGVFINDSLIQPYRPIPYGDIEKFERCKGIQYEAADGTVVQRPDFYRLPVEALQPMHGLEDLYSILSDSTLHLPCQSVSSSVAEDANNGWR